MQWEAAGVQWPPGCWSSQDWWNVGWNLLKRGNWPKPNRHQPTVTAGTAAAPVPPNAPALQVSPQLPLPDSFSPHHLFLPLPKERFPLHLSAPLEVSGLSSGYAASHDVLCVTLCPGAAGVLGACPGPAFPPPIGAGGVRAPRDPAVAAAAPLCGVTPTHGTAPLYPWTGRGLQQTQGSFGAHHPHRQSPPACLDPQNHREAQR